jgi:hypothetical protein
MIFVEAHWTREEIVRPEGNQAPVSIYPLDKRGGRQDSPDSVEELREDGCCPVSIPVGRTSASGAWSATLSLGRSARAGRTDPVSPFAEFKEVVGYLPSGPSNRNSFQVRG